MQRFEIRSIGKVLLQKYLYTYLVDFIASLYKSFLHVVVHIRCSVIRLKLCFTVSNNINLTCLNIHNPVSIFDGNKEWKNL